MKNTGLQTRLLLALTTLILSACGSSLPPEANVSSSSVAAPDTFAVTPLDNQVLTTQQITLQVSGGEAPYSFQLIDGPGQVDAASGLFQASTLAGTANVKVMDKNGRSTTAIVVINPRYSWLPSTAGACSDICGGGTQTRTVKCVDDSGATSADSLCTATKPATTLTCNTQPCTLATLDVYNTHTLCGAGAYCSCSVAFQTFSRDDASALAICKQAGYRTLTSYTTANGPGATQCRAGGSGCFVNQNAGNLVCQSVSCKQ